MSLFLKLKSWYCGVWVPVNEPEERDPRDVVGYLPELTLRIHWTAKLLRILVGFYLSNWRWIWPTFITGVGVFIGVTKALSPN